MGELRASSSYLVPSEWLAEAGTTVVVALPEPLAEFTAARWIAMRPNFGAPSP
jgi:hypothetical protein